MVYLYYRLDHIPLNDPARLMNTNDYDSSNGPRGGGGEEGDCRNEFQKLVASLQSLSQTLQRLEAKLTPG